MTEAKKEDIEGVLTKLFERIDHELYEKDQEELEDYWAFSWDDQAPLEWNMYSFFRALETYGRQIRRWEEHKNGACRVAERVRDKYLFPKIKEFLKRMDR